MNRTESGSALATVIGLLALLSLLGLTALSLSETERRMAAAARDQIALRYLAEAGLQLAIDWFNRNEDRPEAGGRFEKVYRDETGLWTYLDDTGASSFKGTARGPDLIVSGDGLPRIEAWDRIGRIEEVRFFGPRTAGAICTVRALARDSRGGVQAVEAELFPSPIPPISVAVGLDAPGSDRAPVRVHWGEVAVAGDAALADSLEEIPRWNPDALRSGEPYGPGGMEDDGIGFWIAGRVLSPVPGCSACPTPFDSFGHGRIRQVQGEAAVNRSPMGRFESDLVRWMGRRYGAVLVTEADGGFTQDDASVQLADAVASNPGGFVVIQPRDAARPIALDLNGLSGVIVVLGDLVWAGTGSGSDVMVSDSEGLGGGGIPLPGIHFSGALFVTGKIRIETPFRLFGAMASGEGMSGADRLEVWYDSRFAKGRYPGLPMVLVRPGSFRRISVAD